ncbi:MAG: virulence factor [Paracoccaceae bacterium]
MPDVTIVYWRDIPAQVIVGKGRRAVKVPLPGRFEKAIDRCAMRVGARDSDTYLADWRKAEPCAADGDDREIAAREAARLDGEFDDSALKRLIDNDGWKIPRT